MIFVQATVRNDTSLDAIFCGASEIATGAERAAFMAGDCGSDEELLIS